MIKIRYADLPEGIHARAERRGRSTVVFLRPGLTPIERRESLRRARRTARMGYGPRLPAVWLSVALASYLIRTTLRNLAAAMRWHPASTVLVIAVVAGAVVCYVLFVSVSLRDFRPPVRTQQDMPHPSLGYGAQTPGSPSLSGGRPHQTGAHQGAPAGGSGLPSPRTSGPVPTPSSRRTPGPSPSPSTPPPSPTPSTTSTPSGLCVVVGPLGVCLPL